MPSAIFQKSYGPAVAIVLLLFFATIGGAHATESAGLPKVLVDRLLPELAGLLIIATLMEYALATLFNWRLYIEFFNGRAFKTLVMIAFGYMVVSTFNYDVFHRVISFSGGSGSSDWQSKFLSALVLAGGSATVFQLYKALGLRVTVDIATERPKPAANKAWVSVLVQAQRTTDPVKVHIEKIASPTAEQLAVPPIAGVLRTRSFGDRLRGVFTTNPMRFPPSGGWSVDAGDSVYRIIVKAKGNDDGDVVFVGRFADRAIIDFVRKIPKDPPEEK